MTCFTGTQLGLSAAYKAKEVLAPLRKGGSFMVSKGRVYRPSGADGFILDPYNFGNGNITIVTQEGAGVVGLSELLNYVPPTNSDEVQEISGTLGVLYTVETYGTEANYLLVNSRIEVSALEISGFFT